MIISRKRYEEAIQAAEDRGKNKAYEDVNQRDAFRDVRNALDHLETEIMQIKHQLNPEVPCEIQGSYKI